MSQYYYNGPVMEFRTCVSSHWEGTTRAMTEDKARNNLIYQFKKNNNRTPNAKITLPGKLIAIQ